MPDFNQQLEDIAKLRAATREQEESLYEARIGLRRMKQQLARAERGETVVPEERDRAISQLRTRMVSLNATLATLRAQGPGLAAELEQIRTQRQLLDDLKARLVAAKTKLQTLTDRLTQLQQLDPPATTEIASVQAEIEKLRQAISELETAIRAATEQVATARQREATLREQLDALRERIAGLRADLAGLQQKISELQQPVFIDRAPIDANIAKLEAAIDRHQNLVARSNVDLSRAIDGIYVRDPHPRAALARLSDADPFLLFPLRLETIFEGNELRVRVFPDEIVVHTHEAALTDREVDAGQLYWIELLVAAHLRTRRDARRSDAWRHVVDLFGGQRGAWVARNTRPSDWDTLAAAAEGESLISSLNAADPTLIPGLLALPLTPAFSTALAKAIADDDGDTFFDLMTQQEWNEKINAATRTQIAGFPVADLTRVDAWSRAPRTRVLPDRFVLLLYATETSVPQEITGALIADTVFLGPDPLDPATTLVKDGVVRTFGGNCKWLADFDTAVAQGLGFKVPLNQQQLAAGFARVVVLGLRISAGAAHGADMLEELIANHQYSPKGFSLVAQGTPTNNTERDGSGYSDNDPYDDEQFYTAIDPPAFDPASDDVRVSQTDGRLLADALGISYAALQFIPSAHQTDVLEARAMNSALFPATLGYWLKGWMAPVVTPIVARLTRDFFTQYVTGRGPLPAIRVGNQPYGMLVTSDMTRWKYPTPSGNQLGVVALFDEMTPYLRNLHALLVKLEALWQGRVAEVAHVGGGADDSSAVLMKILGLHPTSEEFYQRIGFHQLFLDDLKSFVDPHGRYAGEFYSLIRSLPATAQRYLQNLGLTSTTTDIRKATAFNVLWQHYVSQLDMPNLVENKPTSNTAALTANYIDWLLTADSTNKIIQQKFPGEVPSALLYMMMRNALLLQLYAGVYQWLANNANFTPALEQSIHTGLLMPNVSGSVANVSKFELMSVKVDTVIADHPSPGTSVADWIRNGPTASEAEAAFAQAQRAALEVLSSTTTASLERSLIEHLDCCQYRLDAWETGLFAQRLAEQRRTGAFQDRRTGIYLGAFGWVENLKLTPRTRLSPEALPSVLRPAQGDTGAVLEEDEVPAPAPQTKLIAATPSGSRRGGFTHAPSINHAAAAALLRNAYLSHSDSDQADVLSNNLSSDRARRAEFVLEGMRNGQPIEAMLGYQFERALHDRTSLSMALGESPVLELNEFVQPYRQAFPFEAREIPQAGTGPASETVPPFSVVNGLALISATLNAGNAFGLGAVLSVADQPDAAQGIAIVAARDALAETLDAVKDLLTAENAYQLVQGNFDRVAAVSLAQKDARIPPVLEVLNTPRGSQFTFAHRVTLHFDDLDPDQESSRAWSGALTPRARAEPGVNFWLGTVLGRTAEKASCKIWRVTDSAEDATPFDEKFVTLTDLQIQPVDFVTLATINAGNQGGATELEQRIARYYRATFGAASDALLRIDFDPHDGPDVFTIGQLLPLARRLRALLGECRALNAQDFQPSAGGKATKVAVDKTNPAGVDVAELRARVVGISAALTALADKLDGPAAPTVTIKLLHDADDASDDETFVHQLGDAFNALDIARADFTDSTEVEVTFALLDAQQLQATLHAVAAFGISDAFSPEIDLTDDGAKRALLSRARRVARRLRDSKHAGVLDRANALLTAVPADKPVNDQVTALLQAARILFGDSFGLLPQFTYYNEADLVAADGGRAQLLSYALGLAPDLDAPGLVDEWLQGLARVRPRMNTWETVRMLSEALNDESIEMLPVQIPFRSKDSWLAVEFPEHDPLDATKPFGITRDTLSITAHGASAFKSGAQRGMLLDEWSEEIPTASENTGISFRFNQPNAVPPQSLLLAVTPEQTGAWNWDSLVGILNDTLARAKRRAVEPSQLEKEGSVWNQLAPATVSEFSMVEPADVSLDLLRVVQYAQLNDFYSTVSKS